MFGVICTWTAAALWWVGFELRLNALLDLDPLYVGETADIDVMFRSLMNDKIVAKIFKDVRYLMLTAKIISILVGAAALIYYWLVIYSQPDLGYLNVMMTCL